MDMMTIMGGKYLHNLKADFSRLEREHGDVQGGHGVTLLEFVEGILKYAPASSHQTQQQLEDLIESIIDVFEQIDVNGNNLVRFTPKSLITQYIRIVYEMGILFCATQLDWEEFTAYCVEAGMVATRRLTSLAGFKVKVYFVFIAAMRLHLCLMGLFSRCETALG